MESIQTLGATQPRRQSWCFHQPHCVPRVPILCQNNVPFRSIPFSPTSPHILPCYCVIRFLQVYEYHSGVLLSITWYSRRYDFLPFSLTIGSSMFCRQPAGMWSEVITQCNSQYSKFTQTAKFQLILHLLLQVFHFSSL